MAQVVGCEVRLGSVVVISQRPSGITHVTLPSFAPTFVGSARTPQPYMSNLDSAHSLYTALT